MLMYLLNNNMFHIFHSKMVYLLEYFRSAVRTSMLVLRIVEPKCMLIASHAAPW